MTDGIIAVESVESDNIYRMNSGETLRILLLEDLKSDADIIALHLRKLNIPKDIYHVTNKKDFIPALSSYSPHIILSDYSLPQYNGMEALITARESNPYIPFIICTGSMNEEIAVSCIKAGADDYVLKDSMGRLCSAIENALTSKENLVAKEKAVKDLQSSEENFRAIAQNAPDSIYKLKSNGMITYINRSVDRLQPHEVVGTSIYDYINQKHHKEIAQAFENCFQASVQTSLVVEGRADAGETQWYLCRIGPIMKGNSVESIVLIASNISERIRTEQQTQELNARLQTLTRHFENVREEEKEKIAIEIHDQLGQELTGTKLVLFWIKQRLEEEVDMRKKVEILERVDHLVELTTTTIETVRRIAHELRPVVLDNMGLEPALEWHINNFNKAGQVQCSLHIDTGDLAYDKEFSTIIFRTTQEALTNISRHAEASKAWVDFLIEDDELMLQIRDNGKGLDPKKALESNSLGLFGIRERVKAWNGNFKLTSEPNNGSIIRVTFKLDELLKLSENKLQPN